MSAPAAQEWKMPSNFYDFEKTFGPLRPEMLPEIDWTSRDQMELLFPSYKRHAREMERSGMSSKHISLAKKVDIENFELKTPNEDAVLVKRTQLLVESRKRSAMYGLNGVGKTVLFEAMQRGSIKGFPKHLHVHHMHELDHIAAAEEFSVFDTILNSHPFRRVLMVCQEVLQAKIAECKVEQDKEKLEENLGVVETGLREVHANTAERRITTMLRVLGFDEVGEKRPLSALSGGLRMRVALASAFFIEPELLLLDEPTNHLDFPSVLWLENRLRGYKGAFIVVTHDRQLLENVCTSVMHLADQKITYYDGSFKLFEKTKFKNDEKKDKMVTKFMERNRNVDPTTMAAKTKAEYAAWQTRHHERLVMLAGKFTFQDPPKLKPQEGEPADLDPKEISLIKMQDVRFSYNPAEGHYIFNNPISFDCKAGTRIGVMGPNGAGKSTFLKLLTGKLTATEGKIVAHPDYELAYFGQHSTKELLLEETPKEFMERMFPDENGGNLTHHLAKTSVAGDAAHTRMKNLSYSQRSCVIFAKLTYKPPHLLIMDEPTNFLDLDSVDALISATNKFSGALLVVTHSRDFLKRCANEFLSIVPGQFLTFKNMKEAESATYTFIDSMESGERVNLKDLIAQNPGGGSVHHSNVGDGKDHKSKAASADTDADGNLIMSSLADMKAKKSGGLNAKQTAAAAEAEKKAKAEEKKAKREAYKAAQKTDWKEGDKCYAPVKGKFFLATVTKVTGMGVIVSLQGKNVMFNADKVYEKNPSGGNSNTNNARGGGRGGKNTRGGGRGGGNAGNGNVQSKGPKAQTARGPSTRGGKRGGRGGGQPRNGNPQQQPQQGGNRNKRRNNNQQQQPRGKVRSGSERS